MLVKIDKPDLSLLKGADYPGMILMSLALVCLEYTLEEGPRWGWFVDDVVRTTGWIAIIAGAAFIWRSLTFANPVVRSEEHTSELQSLIRISYAFFCFITYF